MNRNKTVKYPHPIITYRGTVMRRTKNLFLQNKKKIIQEMTIGKLEFSFAILQYSKWQFVIMIMCGLKNEFEL